MVSSAPPAATSKPDARNNSARNAILILAVLFCGLGAAGYWAYVHFGASQRDTTLAQADGLSAEAPPEAATGLEQEEVVELEALPEPAVTPAPIKPAATRPAPRVEPRRATPTAPPAPPPIPEPAPAPQRAAPVKSAAAPPEPVVAAEPEPGEPVAPPRPPRDRTSILMPGAGAYAGSGSPPPGTARSEDPDAPVPIASRFPTRPAAPPPPKTEGDVYWSGQLKKGDRIVVSEHIAAAGDVDGDYFPGQPIEVFVPSPAVRIIERPGPENGWKKLVLECLRSTNRRATINVQWRLASR